MRLTRAADAMILAPTEAQTFIFGYQAILQMLTARHDITSRRAFLAGLTDGRQLLAQEPSAIEVALDKLEDKGVHVEPCVEHAIRTLRLGKWIYLRDTRYYSVFLGSRLLKKRPFNDSKGRDDGR